MEALIYIGSTHARMAEAGHDWGWDCITTTDKSEQQE